MSNNDLHNCDLEYFPSDAYGVAVDHCFEGENGELWVGNGEYATQVNFCPKCGYKAKKEVLVT